MRYTIIGAKECDININSSVAASSGGENSMPEEHVEGETIFR